MVSCIVDASRRRGTSLGSEIANREDPYVAAVDISSKLIKDEQKYFNLWSMLY